MNNERFLIIGSNSFSGSNCVEELEKRIFVLAVVDLITLIKFSYLIFGF